MKTLIWNLITAFLSTGLAFLFFAWYYQPEPIAASDPTEVQLVRQTSQVPVNASPRQWAVDLPADFSRISELVKDAVVYIVAYSATGYRLSSGSGVILTSDGYIITNNHVIEDGSRYEITLSDKRNLTAQLIGVDPMTDLALLKTDLDGLRPVRFGNSDQVQVGQWVLAVGNPFNLTSTVTAGIVSAKARNINILRDAYSIESFIQTDAVVNPGNSGGALVNTRGELIGINTAIISESGGYEGYSFAIPSNLVHKVVEDLREFGTVRRAILGVSISDVTYEMAEELELPAINGVYVNSISRGSSAANAGLRSGDVIISINGVATGSVPELQEQVALFRPGDQVSVEFYRQGQLFKRDNVILKGLTSTASSY